MANISTDWVNLITPGIRSMVDAIGNGSLQVAFRPMGDCLDIVVVNKGTKADFRCRIYGKTVIAQQFYEITKAVENLCRKALRTLPAVSYMAEWDGLKIPIDEIRAEIYDSEQGDTEQQVEKIEIPIEVIRRKLEMGEMEDLDLLQVDKMEEMKQWVKLGRMRNGK